MIIAFVNRLDAAPALAFDKAEGRREFPRQGTRQN
jgi:hypothetical protein